jgi:hypothetical protein
VANYNPHAPQNIGQEWVPIRDENLIYNPYANSFERGYTFTLSRATNVSNVRAYVNTMPNQFIMDRAFTASIYPRGQEDQSGPVRKVIIPCTGGIITGGGPLPFSFVFASDIPTALWNPSSEQALILRVGFSDFSDTYMFFGVSQYQNLLSNKRILGVNFLTSIDIGSFTANTEVDLRLYMANDNTIVRAPGNFGNVYETAGSIRYPNLVTPSTPSTDVRFDRIRLGDVARFFGTTGFNSALMNLEVCQWTYNELARFEASAANRINMAFNVPIAGSAFGLTTVVISYAALEVFYCEETRVGFGTRLIQAGYDSGWPANYVGIGAMPITVRTPAGSPLILQPGDYTVTLSESNLGDSYNGLRTPGRFPIFNENRQLYEIPSVPGVEVAIPFPLGDETINQTLTATSTELIPQLTLHASGATGTLYESHPYGRQTPGQVFNNSAGFVVQRVDTSFLGSGSASFPWIRYWARRYGDTTGTLIASLSGSSATISVAEFDALEEIVDGWKEVTLRFDTPVTLTTGVFPTITWSNTPNLTAGNRWEVLGAAAPSLTGTPFSPMLGQVAAPHTLSIATYGQPVSGGLILESWLPQFGNPFVAVSTADASADVSFILAQDMPTVSGFGVVTTSMAVSGIGRNCGIDPCCIPTAILYNQLSWTGMLGMSDNFNRTVVTGGWGTSSSGLVWTPVSTPNDYRVNGNNGIQSLTGAAPYNTTISTNFRHSDVEIYYELLTPIPTGAHLLQSVNFRRQDANNMYFVNVEIAAGGAVTLESGTGVGGVFTATVITAAGITASATVPLAIRVQAIGTSIKAKVWLLNTAEPTSWLISTNYTNFASGPTLSMYAESDVGNTNVRPVEFKYDNLTITPVSFGSYELQRMDTIDTTWQTIMRSTDVGQVSFKDYEARIGIASSYRIRALDYYEFPGPWSSTATVTLPAIGVSGGSCLQDGHLLVFTTNEIQDGSSNLAYSSVWMDTQVTEDFTFPEADFVQMQAMYDRDFFTAFRPNERGGERFSRTVLVQAAAISPPTLGDFRSLRDMAWDNVSYICVRDEDGNRWFATVLVPSGQVVKNRTIYLAPVDIIEITDTPSEVDP